jgi:preprotein translocase subunit SecG
MSTGVVILLILSILCLIVGLMLSPAGSTTGLTAMAGQDLELFRKTKDRGIIKILQIIMFILMILCLLLCILVKTKVIA